MSETALIFVDIALAVLSLLLIPCAIRIMVGPTSADRLQAVDMTSIILIGVIILLMLAQESPFVLDVGIALAAFGFVATLGIARYLSEGRMF